MGLGHSPLGLGLLLVVLGRAGSGLLVCDLSSVEEGRPGQRVGLLWARAGRLLLLRWPLSGIERAVGRGLVRWF